MASRSNESKDLRNSKIKRKTVEVMMSLNYEGPAYLRTFNAQVYFTCFTKAKHYHYKMIWVDFVGIIGGTK